jgi:gliding motility-associated-like protein
MKRPSFLEILFSKLIVLINFNKSKSTFTKSIFKQNNNLLQLQKGASQLMFCLVLLSSITAFSQLAVPFSTRLSEGSVKVKGDVVLIGNSIITGENLSVPYNGSGNNNSYEGVYINVADGGDPTIFSSSTADLEINNSCKSILYAGLYWASIYPMEEGTNSSEEFEGTTRFEDWNEVKFKLPTGDFVDLVADTATDPVGEEDDIIFDGLDPDDINNSFKDSPIICYKNVTSLLQGLTEPDGTYTVANLRATRGRRVGGCAGGWTLVVIYESPTLSSKFISVFDGYAGVGSTTSVDIPVSGFQTLPAPSPVVAKIGVSALEGDLGIGGDTFKFKASTSATYTNISDALNSSNNFFNSRITNEGSYMTSRNPSSQNTLGFDIKNVNIPNPSNGVVPNDATAGDLRLTTSGDGYGVFVSTFAVDIIEPKILLTKVVEDVNGNDIGGADVTLGDQLNYIIGFQNIGNDDATKLTIRDILPVNVVFDQSDIDILPSGVTVQSYDASTREIIFEVDDSVVEIDDPVLEIRFAVSVVSSCNMLSDACSNSIDNQAYATYEGVFNPNFTISDDPSINTNSGCILTPSATNFLVGVDDCLFTQTEVLCGDSVELTAADGYDSYSWSSDPSGSPVIGTTQSITVNSTGTFYVHNTAIAPCVSIDQEITVEAFGATNENPVSGYADEVVICPNDGKELPNIFLCGANDERLIETGISDTESIIWEKLDETSCDAVTEQDCANESTTCTWNQVATGPDFTADTSGEYRITLNYTGGCFNRYYFKVYQNLLSPNITTQDIICTSPGEISVGGVPSGYEYSLDNVTYQDSNVFEINSQDIYTVYIRQVGVTPNPCVFTVSDIQIRERDFTGSTVITQPYCYGDKGSIKLAANDADPQYSFSIYSGFLLINSVGPINDSSYDFENLNPGLYTVNISTEDGCTSSETVEIIEPPLLTVTAALTSPLTCEDGEITITPDGGTAPYFYFVNSTTDFDTVSVIDITTAGVYDIMVVDSNNCSATTSITVEDNPAPVYTINETDILCYGDDSGEIEFDVTDANGYTLEYSIDNGTTYVTNPVFSNLSSGSYEAILKYTLDTSECFTTVETITISQPDEALTASAGVSELAGCGTSGEGKVRITNPQGGVEPYEYSFDNQSTWITANDAYVSPGTYTLYVRDANGCIYAMPDITLDPEPVAPTIDVEDPTYNCDGSANTTVTVTNEESSSFTYTYLLDGVENTNTADPKTFLNVSEGAHTVTIEYALSDVPTFSNLLQETFGYGEDTSSPGINPTYYCFERQVTATQCKGNIRIQDGDYSVTAEIVRPYGTWLQPGDHTPATTPATADGRFLAVNIGSTIPATEILYEKYIDNIIPNQPINVEFYAINLLRSGTSGANPDLAVALIDASGTEISSYSTGDIPKSNQWEEYPKSTITLDPGANTSLRFILRSNVQQNGGNDVAIDDITVYQLPKSCVTEVEFPIVVDSGQAFTASITGTTDVSCSGSSDGTIGISVQNFDAATGYEYSLDNGLTWTTEMSSPYTITGLSEGTYDVILRYDTCSFPFTETIEVPSLLEVNVSASDITCLTGSTLTASSTGGTAAYSYELLDTATLTLVSTFPNSGVLTDVPSGDYTVRVTDSNGCTATTGVLLTDPTGPSASIASTSDYCYDASTGATIEITATGGELPYEYQLNGGTYQSSNTFTGLTPGAYDVRVRDAYGCTVDLATETIAAAVSVGVSLTKELDCTTSPDAEITGTISGGYAPYTVSLLQGSGTVSLTGSTFSLSTDTADVYEFEVTDSEGCVVASNEVTVNAISPPTVTASQIDVSCNGSSDGTVTLTGSGGSGGYTYSDDNVTFTSTTTFTGLAAGSYDFYIQDSKDCSNTVSVTITEPTALAVTASATTFSCSATNTKESATITIAVPTTGTSPYEYSFNGGATFTSSNTLTVDDNGSDQTFSYVVKDGNGCLTAAQDITISALNPPSDLDFTSTALTCLATTSSVTLTATDGAGVLQYETVSPSPIIVGQQSSNVFDNLTTGTYVFRVTDANGCYYTESYTIDPVVNINVSGLKLSDVLCAGESTGAVEFTVAQFDTSYSYSINSGTVITGQTSSTISLTGLSVGTQAIEVTDESTGCTATTSITIDEPSSSVSLTASGTDVHCNDYNSQITVSATGGTPNYNYAAVVSGSAVSASDYQSGDVVTVDTSTGTELDWDVYVQDSNGCSSFTTVTIIAETGPTVSTPALASNQCTVSTGFTFTVTGTGVAPLTYSINGGSSYQSSDTFTVNTAGSYTVTIKDGNGCTATSSTPTVVYSPLTSDALLTKDITCSAPTDASIDISVYGGNGPYSYEVSTDGGTTYSSITGSPYTTSTAGTYQFKITDANGCEIETNSVVVSDAINPDITSVTETQSITCNSEENAAIEIIIDNTQGLSPFDINVTNTTTGTDYGTQTSGLAAGDYVITVTDAKGCTNTEPITLSEPTAIVLDYDVDPITCDASGTSLGQIIINSVTGGTANYTYHVTGANGYDDAYLNQDGATQIFDVVDFGLYEIIITDANGCSLIEQDILVASPPDDLDINVDSTADCLTGGTVEVSVGTPLSGSGPYHFAIYSGSGMTYSSPTVAPWQDEDAVDSEKTTFTGLIPGATYTFIVFDEVTGCYYYETADVATPTNSTLVADSIVANNITCTGSADGTVDFEITSVYSSDITVNYEVYEALSLAATGVTGSGTVPANGTLSITGLGNLDFGNYVVVVEETSGSNMGCSTVTDAFNITESAVELSITASSTKNENCDELGVITAIGKDGTSPYEYQAVITGDPIVATNWGSSNSFSLAEGDYDIYVKDAYGCVRMASESVVEDPLPTIDPIALQCFDGSSFTITLVEGSGTAIAPLTYSIGGSYQTSADFTISAAGSYTVSIKDGNGCIVSTTYEVNDPLLLDADLSKELDCTTAPGATIDLLASGGTGSGTYTYEVNYNSGGYVAIAGTPYTAASSGTYQFRVTDSESCTAESVEVVVEATIIPTLSTVLADVTCEGGSDGSIIVTATAGVSPFEYNIDGGTFQSSNEFTGLSAGFYDIIVRDSKSCESLPVTVEIEEPTAVSGLGDLTQGLSCGVGNAMQEAIVTITGSDGTPPYTYSFDGGANYTSTNTYSTFTAGTVSALVKDANGCIIGSSIDVVIPSINSPTDLDFTSTAVTCDTPTSEVTLTVTDGVGPFTYEITSPSASASTNSTGVFTGLAADDYVFTVTDSNGCYYTESYTVDPVTNITVSGLLVDDVSCFGGNDGAVSFTVSNFGGTYSYSINGATAVTGQTSVTIDLTGLSLGDQTIVVTDELTNCTDTVTITVSEPVLLTLVESSNINANCNADAQVSVTASAGTPPYTYAFVEDGVAPISSDYSTSSSSLLDPLTNTDWDVWVMDSNGCTTSIDVVVAMDDLPNVDVPTLASNQCNLVGDAYTFTVTNPTGVGPFEYSIGNGYQSSTTFTVNAAGTYSVTIKDANGCTFTNATSITVYEAVDVSSVIDALPSCVDNDGEITVSGEGGSGSYTYSIIPSVGITQSGSTFTGLAASTNYTVTLTDTVTTCETTVDVTLDAATPVSFTTVSEAVTCSGGSDGSITVNLDASNDNPLYSYAIIAGPATFPSQSSNIFDGLETGSYTVQVTSGRGCITTEDVSVGTATAIVVPAPTVQETVCTSDTNTSNFATITVTGVTGGSGTYTQYEFIRDADGVIVQSNSSNVYTVTNSLGGSYTINVYDDQGCLGSSAATVTPFISIDDLAITIDNAITCTNDEDITVSVSSTGGTPNLEYTLEDVVGSTYGAVYSQTNSTGIFTGLPIGNYLATVLNLDTDCTLEAIHYVNDPDTFDLTIDNIVDVTCFSDNDGSAQVTLIDRTTSPTDDSGAFSYELFDSLGNTVATGVSPDAGPLSLTGLLSGTYSITTTLSNAPYCTVDKNFTITAPTAALAISETHTAITCVGADGSISASATGGWPGGYEYELSDTSGVITAFGTASTFSDLSAGDYTVAVRDSVGCEATINVVLVDPTPITLIASSDISTLTCFGDSNATITVSSTTGGQGSNYTYSLNRISPTVSTSGPQSTPVFTGLAAGTYSVTVTDGYSCSATSTDIIITEPDQVVASLVKSASQTCIDSAALTLSASGGTGTYEYSETSDFATVIGSFITSVSFDVVPGTYMYYVRDMNGCEANISNEITIDPLLDLEIDLDTTNASINCSGDTTGVIRASATGGLGNYVYTLQDASGTDISPAPVQDSPGVFTELPVGDYLIEVESGDCLEVSALVSITEPTDPLSVSYTVEDVTCSGMDNGILEITSTGGTGIIKYAISPRLDQFFEDATFENLAPGTYQAIVQDELGCFVVIDFEVEDAVPVLLSLVPDSTFPEVCSGDMDGEFSVELTGGAMPYSVALDDEDGVYTVGTATQTQFDFTNLEGGDHVVYVIDNLGCESEWTISFPDSVLIDPDYTIDYGCVNNTSSNTVTVTVDESITDTTELDYALDGGAYQSSNIFIDVPAGTDHYIDVRHSNGCIKRTSLFEIYAIADLELSVAAGGLNEIVATATGGEEAYEFTLNGESYGSTNTFIYYESGDYTVTVTDSNGCIATVTMYFEFIDVCITNYFTPNGDGVLDTWGPGCTSIYEDLTFDIFDRYGRVVATLRAGQKWDGMYHGKELPTGDYWYVVKLNDSNNNQEFVGHFTLYR